MKKAIFLVLVILAAGVYNNASAQTPTATKGGTVSATDKTPLKPYLDMKLKIASHVRGGNDYPHAATDYIKFGSAGAYEFNFNGQTGTGTWTYNSADKTVTITINGSASVQNLTVTETTVVLKTAAETYTLTK